MFVCMYATMCVCMCAFNIRCIRRFLGVKWWMRKSNLDVRRKAGLPHKMEQVIQFKSVLAWTCGEDEGYQSSQNTTSWGDRVW